MVLALLWAVESGVGTSAPLMTPARIMASRSALTTSVLSVANRLRAGKLGGRLRPGGIPLDSHVKKVHDVRLNFEIAVVLGWMLDQAVAVTYLMIDFWTISTCKSHVGRISARRKGPTPQVSPLSWLRVVMV